VHWDNPTPVVAALVETPDGVVLVRDKRWPDDWFGLVTGFLERGESPEEGTLREVEEELGLTGQVVGLIGVYGFSVMHQLIVAYHVRAQGTIRLGEELAAHKVVPADKLKPWPLGTGHAVRDWLAGRG
jgi:ADP-ribose pyrophosphatase YjhB (NUDIX family)